MAPPGQAHPELCLYPNLLSPKEGKRTCSGMLLLQHCGVYSLLSLPDPKCLWILSYFAFLQLGFLGERNAGFSRKATTVCLLLPLPLGAAALQLPWQLCRAAVQRPVGQRCTTWARPGSWLALGPGLQRPSNALVCILWTSRPLCC